MDESNLAVSVLEAATCHADIRSGLFNPPYHLSNPGSGVEWRVGWDVEDMLRYVLREDTPVAGAAEVEIRF